MADTHFRGDDLSGLLAAVRMLAVSTAPERLFETLVETGRSLLGARTGAFWRCDGSGGLVLAVPAHEQPARLESGMGLAGQCAHARNTLHLGDLRDADDLSDLVLVDHDHEPRRGCALNLPLLAHDGSVLGVLQLLHERCDGFDTDAVLRGQILAVEAALAWQHAQLAASLQQTNRLHSEVEVARAIQCSTLPDEMPAILGYELHGHFQPATYAGGDLFDVVRLEHGVFLLLGDATGHGFGPALSAMQMQGMLRVAFRLGADLDRAYLQVNNQLAEDLPEDRFITAFMGFLDTDAHSVRYHAAGQGPILHFHAADGRCEWHQPSTFPVGVLDLEQVMHATTLDLAPGDILALISDGLYERTNPDNVEFGQDRVGAIVQRGHALPPVDLCADLLAAAEEFADGQAQADDVTMVLVRRTP